MERSTVIILGMLFIASGFLLVIDVVEGKTITVDANGSADFTKIQDAIDNAIEGDAINVWEGTYFENVIVDKSVSLVGNGSEETTIDGGGSGTVVRVTADWVNMSGFLITGSDKEGSNSGIRVESNHNQLFENNCSDNRYGIQLYYSNNNSITDNTASNNEFGIILENSKNNPLTDNTASSNEYGIFLKNSNNNTLIDNTASSNWYGIYLRESDKNTLTNNTANSNSGYGIYLRESDKNTLIDNTANSHNRYGIYIYNSSDNNLTNNTASYNSEYGIYLYRSNDNTLRNNTMSHNSYNFYITGSSKSHFYQTIDPSNTVDGKPVYYLVGKQNETIDIDAFNIGFFVSISCNNITVKNAANLTKNGYGILFYDTSNSFIQNITTDSNYYGIYLWDSDKNTLIGNTANSNNRYGIHLYDSNDNTLTNNTASNNIEYGIYLGSSNDNTLGNNTMSHNSYNFYITGSSISHFYQSIDTLNTVDGKPVYYLVGNQNESFDIDALNIGFFASISCDNITVRNAANLTKNGYGILFYDTNNSFIQNITTDSNYYGIYLRDSNKNTLSNNIANSNSENGISLMSSNNNTLIDNRANSNNRYGIYLDESSDNTLTNNTASNNDDGILLYYSSDNTLANNTCSNNNYGIRLHYYSRDCTITNNTCNSNSYYGIYLYRSDSNILTNNTCSSNNRSGIYLYSFSRDCTITNNNCSSNTEAGILLYDSSDCAITNNICSSNTEAGISLYESSDCTIMNNKIFTNRVGISLRSLSRGNTAYHNNIFNNTEYGINATDNNHIMTNATNNWWGVASGPYHPTLNPDGEGDNITDYVEVHTWIGKLTLVYNANKDWYFTTIQSAIDEAKNGDTIRAYEGTFFENVVVDKSVSLVGNGSETTTIDGGRNGTVLRISADWVNIRGFHVTGSGSDSWDAGISGESNHSTFIENDCSNNEIGIYIVNSSHNTFSNNYCSNNNYGIRLDSSSNSTISSNTCENNGNGIYLMDSSNCAITNNTCNSNYDHGIFLTESSDCTIMNNICENNENGIRLYDSNDSNTLTNNTCNSNTYYGIYLYRSNSNTLTNNTCISNNRYGIYLLESSNSTITNNSANSNYYYGIYLHESSNSTLTNNTANSSYYHYGIFLDKSSNCTITNNSANSNYYYGIYLHESSNSTLTNNTANSSFSHYGIFLDESSNNTLTTNTASNNDESGIFLYSSHNNTLTNNTASNNQYGIRLYNSRDCTITNSICNSNYDHGIYLSGSSDCSITNSICNSNNDRGIYLTESSDCTITNNTCNSNNDSGIYLRDSSHITIRNTTMIENGIIIEGDNYLESWNSHTIDTSNSVNGKSVYYYKNVTGLTVPSWAGQVILANCSWMNVEDQNCSNTSVGILVGYSSNITLANNTCSSNNENGILIDYSSDFTITNNTCESNNEYGINLYSSSDCIIENNTINKNRIGIYLKSSSNIKIHYNYIFNNTEYGILADHGNGRINATYNWWGNFSGPYHHSYNLKGKGDNVSYSVEFDPWHVLPFYVDYHYFPPQAMIESPQSYDVRKNWEVDFMGGGKAYRVIKRFSWLSDLDGEIYNGTNSSFTLFDLSLGIHTIYLKIQDEFGQWSDVVSIVYIANFIPTVYISYPEADGMVHGEISIYGNALDKDSTIKQVEISINGEPWLPADGYGSWTYEWNTEDFENGKYTIRVRSYDGLNTSEEINITVTVENQDDKDRGGFELHQIVLFLLLIIAIVIFSLIHIFWSLDKNIQRNILSKSTEKTETMRSQKAEEEEKVNLESFKPPSKYNENEVMMEKEGEIPVGNGVEIPEKEIELAEEQNEASK